MKILLVGHGAREHAIAVALSKSPQAPEIFAYMSVPNPGIVNLAVDWENGRLEDVERLKRYASRVQPDLVIFGPEVPLAAGAVDELEAKGFSCVGPRKLLAMLESDKAFMRQFLAKYIGKGSPKWFVFTDLPSVEKFIRNTPNVVMKPVGLTGGKGVRVVEKHFSTLEEALKYADFVLKKDGRILVEERLSGNEFSLMVFTDGRKCLAMPLVQDYKYAYEGDTGPMTGGMGAYSCADHLLPFITKTDYENAFDLVCQTVEELSTIFKIPYRGILYGQFIQTSVGPKLIEFNVRFGDPEAINVLSILNSDIVEVFSSIANGDLVENVEFLNQATVCKYLVPKGYPDAPKTGVRFSFPIPKLLATGVEVYFASVFQEGNQFVTTTARALALLARAETPILAKNILNGLLAEYCPDELYYRRDIPYV